MQRYDVVVVGAGPSGCSAAINCATLGLEVLLLDRKMRGSRKPCGGVLPWVALEVIEDVIGAELPSSVMTTPKELGLYYVPPSGKKNAGAVNRYRIHNIVRERLDDWLLDVARENGVDTLTETEFISLTEGPSIHIRSKRKGEEVECHANYLVGADGVRSRVRQQISLESLVPDFLIVGQQLLGNRKQSDLGENFCGFLRGDISIAYSYAIPKGNDLLIGTGVRRRESPNIAEALVKFKQWLASDFNVDISDVIMKESWAIPFGFFALGRANVLLAGDAAGLCNPLSGEGIRLGIESGEAVASAISRAQDGADPLESYRQEIGGLAQMVGEIHKFVIDADDSIRESFVADELKRGTI